MTASPTACYRDGHGRQEDESVLLAHAQGLSRTHRVVIFQAKEPPVPSSLGAASQRTPIFLICHHHDLVLVVIVVASVLEGSTRHTLMVQVLGLSSLLGKGFSRGALDFVERLRGKESAILSEVPRVPLMIVVLIVIVVGGILVHQDRWRSFRSEVEGIKVSQTLLHGENYLMPIARHAGMRLDVVIANLRVNVRRHERIDVHHGVIIQYLLLVLEHFHGLLLHPLVHAEF